MPSYGATPGSDAYVNCRVAQQKIRSDEDIAADKAIEARKRTCTKAGNTIDCFDADECRLPPKKPAKEGLQPLAAVEGSTECSTTETCSHSRERTRASIPERPPV